MALLCAIALNLENTGPLYAVQYNHDRFHCQFDYILITSKVCITQPYQQTYKPAVCKLMNITVPNQLCT